jgi:predicted GNAT family acetyltransferase
MEIVHEMERRRFVFYSDGQESVLEYRLLADDGIDFTRTFVPGPLRGQGIAEKLVRSGIAWARDRGFTMQASCWYVRRFLRHRR